jgi:hypothetical protein
MCTICDGNSRDHYLSELDDIIRTHGWAIQGVKSDHPPDLLWAYTVGLTKSYDHPELVLVGETTNLAFVTVNRVASLVRDGERLAAGDHIAIAGLGEIALGAVHPAHVERGLLAMWSNYHSVVGPPVSGPDVLQVILPDEQCCAIHQRRVPLLAHPDADPDRFPGPRPAPPNRAQRRAAERLQRRTTRHGG